MAQRVYSSQKMLEEKNAQAQNSGGNFAKAEFVNLKPDAATGETVRHLRIIGCPIRFRQFTDKKRKEGEKGVTVRVPFPDAALNTNFTRIGTENDPAYGECPWTKMGYIGSWRYAVNVLERQKDGSNVVKILEKGGSIFNKFMEMETNNRELNAENPDDEPLCVMLGGAIAHDVKIKAKANPQALGGVEYVVAVNPRKSQITDEEIELLRAIGTPTDEEIAAEKALYEQDRKEDPQLPEWEDWYLYGYKLGQIFKPTPVKTEASGNSAPATVESTSSDELVIDDEPAPAAPVTAAGKPKGKKAAPAAELANPFDDDDGAVAVAVATEDEPDWD